MSYRRTVEMAAADAAGTMPANVNLSVYQGDDFFLTVTVDDSVTPIDLTLYTPKSQIRPTPGDANLLATFDVTVLDATHLQLHLTSAESTKLPTVARSEERR